jgi:hypothetical protein
LTWREDAQSNPTASPASVGFAQHSYFIQFGNVRITADREEIVATPGMVVRVPKMTPHAWKSHNGPCRLLVTFIPGGRQTDYLKELDKLVRSGDSRREGVTSLQKNYDNIPL